MVDSEHYEAYAKLILAARHASQTPDRYYALQDQVAAMRGLEAGYHRAEAFVLQVQSPGDPLLVLGTRKMGIPNL